MAAPPIYRVAIQTQLDQEESPQAEAKDSALVVPHATAAIVPESLTQSKTLNKALRYKDLRVIWCDAAEPRAWGKVLAFPTKDGMAARGLGSMQSF